MALFLFFVSLSSVRGFLMFFLIISHSDFSSSLAIVLWILSLLYLLFISYTCAATDCAITINIVEATISSKAIVFREFP